LLAVTWNYSKIHFSTINSYMFRHLSSILKESIGTKKHKFNTLMQVLIPSLDGKPVPKHVGINIHNEFHFMICILSYFIECICWM